MPCRPINIGNINSITDQKWQTYTVLGKFAQGDGNKDQAWWGP